MITASASASAGGGQLFSDWPQYPAQFSLHWVECKLSQIA